MRTKCMTMKMQTAWQPNKYTIRKEHQHRPDRSLTDAFPDAWWRFCCVSTKCRTGCALPSCRLVHSQETSCIWPAADPWNAAQQHVPHPLWFSVTHAVTCCNIRQKCLSVWTKSLAHVCVQKLWPKSVSQRQDLTEQPAGNQLIWWLPSSRK